MREHRIANNEILPVSEQLTADSASMSETIEQLVGSGGTYEDLRAAMAALEWLAERATQPAILLMAVLYTHADRVYAHEICDAIDLWIENEGTPALSEKLKKGAADSIIPPTKASEWIALLEAKREHH